MFESELSALEALFDFVIGFPEAIASSLVALVQIVFYPFVCLLQVFVGWWTYVSGVFTTFSDSIVQVYDVVVDFFNVTLGAAIPSAWTVLLLLMLGLNVGFRVYSFVKNIQLFGFSI